MLTIKLNIKSNSDSSTLANYINNYTGLFYKLYNNPELLEDKSFICEMLFKYNLDKSLYDMCVSDVKSKLNQRETNIKIKNNLISNIEDELTNNLFKSLKSKYKKYKLINKLNYLKKTINTNITFGGKSLLQKITKLSQTKSNPELLTQYKNKFKVNRLLPINLIGRACEHGNRKIKFDLINYNIIFKPNKNTNIKLNFYTTGKQYNTLCMLQQLADLNAIPLSVKLSNNSIYLSYDEELINGYSFNEILCKKEQKLSDDINIKKEIYIKYKEEQRNRKLRNKIKNRYISIDLNPEYIGFTIFDKDDNKQYIIHKEAISLIKLNIKFRLSSDNIKSVKQNNKRKHEIREIWNYIFRLCKHYRVAYLIIEELEFKETVNTKNNESNRKIKNIWHRTLTSNLIKKYCNIMGIELIEVNPYYSSFIGNMIHSDFDPIASSLELGRRGMNKYVKGNSLYPEISLINQEKLNYLLGENIDISGLNWKQLYAKASLLRYRNPLTGVLDKKLESNKSKVIRHISL